MLIPESASEEPKLNNSISIYLTLISNSLQYFKLIHPNAYLISLLFKIISQAKYVQSRTLDFFNAVLLSVFLLLVSSIPLFKTNNHLSFLPSP